MQREEFIQILFDNCSEYIGDNDYLSILEYINKFIKDKKIGISCEKNFIDIYADLITNMFDRDDILNLEYKLPIIIWLKCAENSGIKDITIDMDKLDIKLLNDKYIEHMHYPGKMLFNNITIINLTLNNHDRCYLPTAYLPEIYVSTLTVEYSGYFDVIPDVLRMFDMFDAGAQKSVQLNVKTSSQIDFLYIPRGFNMLAFDADMKELPKNVSSNISNIKQLKLPEIDNIKIPLWIKKVDKSCTIYKKKGQKISCYKVVSEFVNKHLQSI